MVKISWKLRHGEAYHHVLLIPTLTLRNASKSLLDAGEHSDLPAFRDFWIAKVNLSMAGIDNASREY